MSGCVRPGIRMSRFNAILGIIWREINIALNGSLCCPCGPLQRLEFVIFYLALHPTNVFRHFRKKIQSISFLLKYDRVSSVKNFEQHQLINSEYCCLRSFVPGHGKGRKDSSLTIIITSISNYHLYGWIIVNPSNVIWSQFHIVFMCSRK